MDRGSSSNQQPKSAAKASKSGIVIQEPTNTTTDANSNNSSEQTVKRSADQYMPMANIVKIMRSVLPPNANISDDAKETIQECVSEFISFITNKANGKCKDEHRKILIAEDVLSAMGALGFDDYLEPLTVFLNKYRAKDSNRNTMHPMQFKRSSSMVHQPEAQMVRPAPPVMGYQPTPMDQMAPPPQIAVYRPTLTARPPQVSVYRPAPMAQMAPPPQIPVYRPAPMAQMAPPPQIPVYRPTPMAQMARPPQMMGYKAESSGAYTARGNEHAGLPQIGDYHRSKQGSGEGSSRDLEFDPFKRSKH